MQCIGRRAFLFLPKLAPLADIQIVRLPFDGKRPVSDVVTTQP
jgi:hypothetical protein